MQSRRSVCAALVVLITAAAPLHAQLSYVDRSTGLQTPQMEGGNTELEFGDVDGDGQVDIVSIGDHGSPYIGTPQHGVMVWFGDGTGRWSVYQSGDFGYGGIALGDVNNDGLMDVGYAMHHDYSGTDFGDQLLEVALGDGTGRNWTAWDDGLATAGESWGMFGTDFADVDNDGDLDVGSVSFGCCSGIHVYLNHGDGSWTHGWGFIGGNSNMIFQFGDVNGDGNADFAAAHGLGTVYFGDGAGGFALADGNLPSSSYGHRGVSLGDVNDDGRDDLSLINSSGGLSVWTWVAPGSWQNISGALPTSGDFERAQIADMNLDGHGDLAAFAPGEPGRLVVYTGDGAGTWTLAASVGTPDSCGSAALRAGTDADHNGYPDIVFVAEENCSIWTGGTNRPRCFVEGSIPSSTWVHPQYPRGGETFLAGSVRFVKWTAAVGDAGPTSMTIELSQSGPDGPWQLIADDLPDNGCYQWLVPAMLPSSSNCYVRYALAGASGTVSAVTPGAFSVTGGAALPGDIDGDGDVDLTDLALLLAAYDSCEGDPFYNPDADLDQSGCVGLADLATLLASYGSGG